MRGRSRSRAVILHVTPEVGLFSSASSSGESLEEEEEEEEGGGGGGRRRRREGEEEEEEEGGGRRRGEETETETDITHSTSYDLRVTASTAYELSFPFKINKINKLTLTLKLGCCFRILLQFSRGSINF